MKGRDRSLGDVSAKSHQWQDSRQKVNFHCVDKSSELPWVLSFPNLSHNRPYRDFSFPVLHVRSLEVVTCIHTERKMLNKQKISNTTYRVGGQGRKTPGEPLTPRFPLLSASYLAFNKTEPLHSLSYFRVDMSM